MLIMQPIAPQTAQNIPIFAAACAMQHIVADNMSNARKTHHAKGRYFPIMSLVFSIKLA
jgi:hypothetical protein